MGKSKGTPVPLPKASNPAGKNPFASKPAEQNPFAAKAPLSNEFVGDSDSGSEADETPSKPQKKSAKDNVPLNIAIHKPNGASKKIEEARKQLAKKKDAQKAAAAPKKVVKPAPKDSTSESESSDESDGGAQTKEVSSKNNGGNEVSSTSTSSEEASSKSASDSDSDSGEESEKEEAAPATEVAPKPKESHTVSFRPAQPYVPPKGFAAVNTATASKSSATELFDNLGSEKQIWHITAPSDISISDLKEFALEKALSGDTVLKIKDREYGFRVDEYNANGEAEVLIPKQKGYEAVSKRISRTLHLHQRPHLPKIATQLPDEITGSEASASITRSTIRAPRPQVKGLKMRYFHSGFGDMDPGILGESDSEDGDVDMRDAQASAGAAVNGTSAPKKGKRKHEDAEKGDAPTKKHKKHKTAEEIKRKEEKKEKKKKEKSKAAS